MPNNITYDQTDTRVNGTSEKVFEGSDPWLNRKENPDVNNDIEEVN